jgi:hypothetical protein
VTETMRELVQSWKTARYQQIKKLYSGGVTRQELVNRFGAQNVSNALDKTFRYQ